jgi:hypothetical protein
LNGGQGGAGQEGGNGAATTDGSKCTIPSSGDKCVNPNCNPRPYRADATTPYYSYGSTPAKGGDGGSGGIGGYGGLAGSAKITTLQDSQTILNRIGSAGNRGIAGRGGIGAIGGCIFKCTRTLYWSSSECCSEWSGSGSGMWSSITGTIEGIIGTIGGIIGSIGGIFGRRSICIDTCDSESWSALAINCDSRQNGWTPTSKNANGIVPNEIPYVDYSNQLLLDYKSAVLQKGFSNFYPSFVNAIGI